MLTKIQEEVQEYNNHKLVQAIQQDLIKPKVVNDNNSDNADMPFTDDSSEDQNYLADVVAKELWKVREITRIKNIQEAKTKWEKEQCEILRRRNLTEEERQREDEVLGTDGNQKKQTMAYNFMQKYYHKGAFY